MFLSILCLLRLQLFEQKYSKNSNIVQHYINLNGVFLFEYILNVIYSCEGEISAVFSVKRTVFISYINIL